MSGAGRVGRDSRDRDRDRERGSGAMTIGVLGTGGIAVTLAAMFARAGHEVRLGPAPGGERERSGASGVEGLDVPGVTVGRHAEVVVASAVVIPAVLGVQGAVQQLRPWRAALGGKILVDITNPFTGGHVDFVGPWAAGGTSDLAAAFPEARLVGAFKNVWWEAFDGNPDPAVPDIRVISDDAAAKRTFLRLCAATPFTYVDAGGVDQARRVERMALSGAGPTGLSAA
ncbi:NADPH-dependent F420 reductase [Streptomyces sp. NPDC006285]|uniref:NADPH-dependent F420 reductase n=1 Tax=Streptomyces sp. NPDC006285 TaxID=3364742 RepID=UPI003696FBDF